MNTPYQDLLHIRRNGWWQEENQKPEWVRELQKSNSTDTILIAITVYALEDEIQRLRMGLHDALDGWKEEAEARRIQYLEPTRPAHAEYRKTRNLHWAREYTRLCEIAGPAPEKHDELL